MFSNCLTLTIIFCLPNLNLKILDAKNRSFLDSNFSFFFNSAQKNITKKIFENFLDAFLAQMSENGEFDVSLLDDLKPLDCFLENELEKGSNSDDSFDHEESLELDFLEDFLVNADWPLEKRVFEVAPYAEVTSISTNSGKTAIGLKDGTTLIFGSNLDLECRIESAEKNFGSVSASGLSADGKRILIGYSRGKVLMYDVTSPKSAIRKLPANCHVIATASVNLASFTSKTNSLGICADSSSISGLEFTRVMARRGTELYQIYRGEMVSRPNLFLASSHLTNSKSAESHPLYDHPLCAILTPLKLVIKDVSKTELKDMELTFPHTTSSPNALCCSWQMNENLEPVLSLAHGQRVTCFRLDRCSQWVIDRVIELEEIASYITTFPRKSSIFMLKFNLFCNRKFFF